MGKLAVADQQHLNTLDPSGRLFLMMKKYEDAINNVASQAAAAAVGTQAAPPSPSAVSVQVLAPGVHHVQIQDNNPVSRGLWYHYEFSTSPDFEVGTVIHSAATPSRDHIAYTGAGPVYWRAYSQYTTSDPSIPVTAPAAVDAGGAARVSGINGAGSGTEPNTQPQPGAGFGFTPNRSPNRLPLVPQL